MFVSPSKKPTIRDTETVHNNYNTKYFHPMHQLFSSGSLLVFFPCLCEKSRLKQPIQYIELITQYKTVSRYKWIIYVRHMTTTLSRRMTSHLSDISSIKKHLDNHKKLLTSVRKILVDDTIIQVKIIKTLYIKQAKHQLYFNSSSDLLVDFQEETSTQVMQKDVA